MRKTIRVPRAGAALFFAIVPALPASADEAG